MLIGGAGDDTLNGNAGNDMLMGGSGNNALDGGAGNDYYGVMRGDTGNVTEAAGAAGGDDSLRYIATDDDDSTMDDESKMGVGDDADGVDTPANVETVFGTANNDHIDVDDSGAAVLGREGDDDLDGGAGEDTLVGCAGENTLSGGGGDDTFGVYNGGADAADTIEDFATGATDTATTDEIHLKGFAMGLTVESAVTFAPIADNVTQAAVQVNGVTVAKVGTVAGSNIEEVTANPGADPPVAGKSLVQAIIEALEKSGAVAFDHAFVSTKCETN